MKIDFSLFNTQKEFACSDKKYPAFIGGYGAGKTYVNSVKALIHSIYHNPGLPGLLVAPSYRDLRDTNIPTLLEIMEEKKIPYRLLKTNYLLELPWWNSRILLRSADEPERLKGPNVAWAGIDEVARIKEEIWGVLVSRVRHPRANLRQTYATGTPEGLNWVYERWVEREANDYQLFQAATSENKMISSFYLSALEDSHDEEELKEKLYGQFSQGSKGRVYKKFDRRIHLHEHNPLSAGNSQIVNELPLCLTCDFNITPCCWLLLQHRQGLIYVLDEIVLEDTNTLEMCQELKQRGYGKHQAGIIVYGDPSGNARSTTAARSDYAIIKSEGFARQNIARCAPAVKDRINAVNARLLNSKGETSLFINSKCKSLIRDLERVKWKEGSAGILDKGDLRLTHASDALGYFVHQEYSLTRIVPRPMKVSEMINKRR